MYTLENLSERYQERFNSTFTPSVVDAMLGAVHRGYESASDLHDPARGSEEANFGLGVYSCTKHELALLATPSGAPWRVTHRTPQFRLSAGGIAVASYRVGRNERQNINTSFPNPGRNGAPSAGREEWLVNESAQLPLFPEAEQSTQDPTRLVLCHMGNSDDGFCAAYLCAPRRMKGRRQIIGWGLVHQLWKRDEGSTGYLGRGVRLDERPAPEETPEASPRRRARPQTDTPN